jgi:hypothetical protein
MELPDEVVQWMEKMAHDDTIGPYNISQRYATDASAVQVAMQNALNNATERHHTMLVGRLQAAQERLRGHATIARLQEKKLADDVVAAGRELAAATETIVNAFYGKMEREKIKNSSEKE